MRKILIIVDAYNEREIVSVSCRLNRRIRLFRVDNDTSVLPFSLIGPGDLADEKKDCKKMAEESPLPETGVYPAPRLVKMRSMFTSNQFSSKDGFKPEIRHGFHPVEGTTFAIFEPDVRTILSQSV